MVRRALHVAAMLVAFAVCSRALAHGIPAEAYAVISHDAMGPRAVSLSAGVALRRSAQRYQFMCPMAWGDQFASPLAALADGTIVIGATRGLMLLNDDGTLRPHPDPAAVGRTSDVVRSARGVFALRPTAEGTELLAVDAQAIRVLWKDAKMLYSLAALDDKLVLVRVTGTMLEQVTVSPDGVELERQMATLDLPVDYVFARANAGAAYALVIFRNGSMAIGSVQMNAFTKLAEGLVSIGGPLSVENVTLLALDGKLTQLVGGQATPLADDHNVVCLAQHDGLTYACDDDGIARMSGQTVGEPLFRFSWLVAPDLARITDDEARLLCNSQWQDLRFDVQLRGVTLDVDSMPPATAPVDPSLAGAGGAAQPGAAGLAVAGTGAAGGGAAGAPGLPVQEAGTGCSAVAGRATPPRAAGAYAFAFALALALARSRRARRR